MAKKTAAKKPVTKKPRRRLKRTARRSLAAVLMITAVVVAAIPVPENAAATDDYGISALADDSLDVHESGKYLEGYDSAGNKTFEPYGYKPEDVDDLPLGVKDFDLSTYAGKTDTELVDELKKNNGLYASLKVANPEGSTYTLEWEFMYYEVRNPRGGATAGAICKYNTVYYDEPVLSLFPNTEYFTTNASELADYYAGRLEANATKKGSQGQTFTGYGIKDDTNTFTQIMDNDPTKGEKIYSYTQYENNNNAVLEEFLKKYPSINTRYIDVKAEYDKYKADKAAWEADKNNTGNYEDDHPKPDDFVVMPATDLDQPDQWKYFCAHNLEVGTGDTYTLVPAKDNRPGGKQGDIYLAKGTAGNAGEEGSKSNNDRYGFLVLKTAKYQMCAIADKAFYGTENVKNITIPEQIGFIGDDAFAGSKLEGVSFANVTAIGNRAFKGCVVLKVAELDLTVERVGNECFSGTKIEKVKFGSGLKRIGYGAFYGCNSLGSVVFEDKGSDVTIDGYAFYNCSELTAVSMKGANIVKIDDGAFATDAGSRPMGFTLSDRLSGPDSLGNYLFAGRSNLEYVVFPGNYANSTVTQTKIPPAIFHGCINLKYVTFPTEGNPTACGFVEYDSKILFADVINKDFYVEGPELNSSNRPAYPRRDTWDAITAVSTTVPYLYHQGEGANRKDFWEISDGFYLLSINGTEGILTSCTLKPNADVTKWNGVLDIPKKVGDTPVKGIGENCFTDSDLNSAVVSIRIPDDSIETIAAGVFKGGTDGKTDWLKLKDVYIGNSVKEIGASAFEGCTALNDIFLNSPKVAHSEFKLGDNAFKTGSNGLTIHGDIATDYSPYTWAMGGTQASCIRSDGLRACYKSLVPSYLTVIYDNNTQLATLMDYPKEKDISKILDEAYKFDIMAGPDGSFETPYKDYVEMRKAQSYATWRGEENNFRRDAFKKAWIEATTDAEREAVYESDNYGPWVNDDFVSDSTTWGTAAPTPGGGGTSGGGDSGAINKIADFFFEPIVAYAAEQVYAYYDPAGPRGGKYEIGVTDPTDDELRLLDNVRNIVVPEGVDSIDVYSYVYGVKDSAGNRTGRENNQISRERYFGSAKQGDSWDMYTSSTGQEESDPTKVVPGLFSGDYNDGLGEDSGERFRRGNDQITSVVLNSVTYLPDYAFDSCENLLSVDLGAKCSDIGVAPFRGCYEMETVGDNEWYTTTNGIIYSKNTDGSLTIEECLSARGRKVDKVGPPIVSVGTGDSGDSNLKSVSAIKPGAFEDCDDLTEINFGSNNTAGLQVIPDDCFKNSDVLQTVVLPITVNDIGPGAFVGAKNLRELTIYGSEVKISGSAFNEDKVQTTVNAPEDSAVVRYVKEYGSQYKLSMSDKPFGKQWKVTFYDANYKVIEDLVDGLGSPINNPQYVTNGESIPAIPADPVLENWTFENWIRMDGKALREPITEDTIFYAKGHYDGGAPVDGKYTVEFIDGVDGSQVAGRGSDPTDGKYYVEAGKTFTDMKWPEPTHPTHAGFEASGFIFTSKVSGAAEAWTTATNVNENMTVIALYKASGNNGPTSGGSTNTSGNTTSSGTTSGGTTSTSSSSTSSSSSSNKSSSSSSSGSSTSTTSTTNSSAAGMYTVFVENGYGSGSYAPGTMVIVTAAQPAAGMRFDKWTTESNGVTLVSVSLPATTFQMPANNVSIKANFVADTTPRATAAPGTGNSSGTGNGTTNDNGNTRVDIEKPGISNRDLATANVNGSTDNFIVKISETDEATRAVAAALTNKYGTLDNILYYAMDITLWDSTGTTQISDTTGLSVDITIPIPDSLVAYGGNNMAGAVVNGDQLESLNENFTTINGVPCIRFRATHFSPYTIYVDTGNLVEGMLDTTPKTGDPIHPKWFLSLGLACLSMILFLKRDKRKPVKVKKA